MSGLLLGFGEKELCLVFISHHRQLLRGIRNQTDFECAC
jgi:hypothetical protein